MKNIFKVLLLVIALFFSAMGVSATGWEANYGGVMLQGFYWDSFEDTKWTNLTSQADELSAYFDLIWVPNSGSSGYYSMGYMPQYWFQHESSFGTASELRNMINTFKEKGTGIIADVVINHRNGVNGWYDFPVETDHNGNTWELGLWAICGNDEMAYADGQPTPTGANDEGENFDGCRDLDHTNATVQNAIKAYLDYLLNYLGYAGFRYDMTKGFAAYYVGLYNAAVNPKYSVGEYYDGNYDLVTQWIDGTIRNNEIQSGSFDFPMKFKMNEAFGYPSDFSKLVTSYNGSNQPNGLIKEAGFRRFSVTFVDNHDTYRDGGTLFNEYYTVAGNAFILCHPGTPCVFLPHWQTHKDAIKRLIDVRKSVGIHNQSTVEVWEASTDKYVAKVYGNNGDLFIKVGYGDYTPDGFNSNDIVASGEGYCVWSKVSIESAEDKIVPANDRNGFSVYVEKNSVPASWADIYCYAWVDESTRLTSVYPGEKMTKVVTIDGVEYYKYSFDASTTTANVLFADGEGGKTVDLTDLTGDTYYSFSSTNSSGNYTMSTLSVTGTETGEPITVYLDKSSIPASWGSVKYYAWDTADNKLLGAWSGTVVTDVATFNGVDYYKYTFPETVTVLNLIFNDGSNQSEDVMGITRTGFYALGDVLDSKYDVKKLNVSDGQGISVYLEKNSVTTAWGKVSYYAWDNNGTILTDVWPGTTVTQTEVVNNVEYYKYTFDSSVDELNVIFTNGTNQTADLESITADTYYTLVSTDGAVSEVNPNDYTGEVVDEAISIYLRKKSVSSWSKVNYYAWDSNGILLDAWPGKQMTSSDVVEVCGEEFYVYTFPEDVESLNIIFNNGSGQTGDITNVTKSTYYSIYSDFSYSSGVEPITIFLEKNSASAWSKVKYYAWDKDERALLGSWSGTQITETMMAEDGNEYYFYTFAPSISPVNIIFNDGSNQTTDLSATRTTFYKLNSTSGKSITVSTVNTSVATDIATVKSTTECVIYPNPVTTDFVVRSAVDVDYVCVYDLNGTLLQQVHGNVVDARNLPQGFYLYRVVLANGTVEHGRFIKK